MTRIKICVGEIFMIMIVVAFTAFAIIPQYSGTILRAFGAFVITEIIIAIFFLTADKILGWIHKIRKI